MFVMYQQCNQNFQCEKERIKFQIKLLEHLNKSKSAAINWKFLLLVLIIDWEILSINPLHLAPGFSPDTYIHECEVNDIEIKKLLFTVLILGVVGNIYNFIIKWKHYE